MLRAFMILLSLVTDHEVIGDAAQRAFVMGLTSACIFGCVGVGFAVRYWLARRSRLG